MFHRPIPPEVKKIILSQIINPDHRYVMQLILDGKSYNEVADTANYTVRQITRLVPTYFREICLVLADQIVKIKG